MEFYINETVSLSYAHGEVHVVFLNEDNKEVLLTFNSHELIKDIPSLFKFAQMAEEKSRKYYKDKYDEMIKDIKKGI